MTPLISMATCKIHSAHSPFCAHRFQETFTTRKRNGVMKVSVKKAKLSEPNVKKANLCATRKEKINIPNYSDGENSIYHISQFLSHPSGIEAILNSKALQSYQSLDSNLYSSSRSKVNLESRLLERRNWSLCSLDKQDLINDEFMKPIGTLCSQNSDKMQQKIVSCIPFWC